MAPRDVKLVDGETEARKNRMTYLRSVGAFGGQPASVVSLGATSKSQTPMEGWGEERGKGVTFVQGTCYSVIHVGSAGLPGT